MPLARLPQPYRVVLRVGLIALLPVLGLGCDEAPEREATAPTAKSETASPAIPRIKWLDSNDQITPERWLASRAAHADLPESAPEVATIRVELDKAAEQFRDPPRMIANRAVQLEEMLSAKGIEESAPELIRLLSDVTARTGLKEGFGSVCQHYFNLRQQGVGREAALEQLKQASLLLPIDTAKG